MINLIFLWCTIFFSFVWLLLFVHFNNVWSFCDLYIWRLCYAGRLLFREIYIYLQNCLNIDVYNIIQLYFSHTVTYKGIILYFHGSEDRMTFLGICKRAVFVHWFNTFYRYRNLQRVLYFHDSANTNTFLQNIDISALRQGCIYL